MASKHDEAANFSLDANGSRGTINMSITAINCE